MVNEGPHFQSLAEPPAGRVQRAFEAWAARTPDVPAVASIAGTLTYGELNRAANRLARRLRSRGVGPDVLVGTCLGRTPDAVVAILAVLKAGGAYVPLDPGYPAERLAYMLENSGAGLVLTDGASRLDWPASVILLRVGEEGAAAVAGDEENFTADPAESGADPLAYVIYTSGSTGRPKGVAMPHGPLVSLLRWQARACPLLAGRKVLQFAPLSFDVSFQEIFSTLGEGGTLVLISEEQRRDPRGLLHLLGDANIGRVFLPPVMLYQLAEQFADGGGPLPGGLREVITAGEALRVSPVVSRWFAAFEAHGGCALHNHYGPTETHVATAFTCTGPVETWPAVPPIGKPIDGAQALLLDEQDAPVGSGQPGELYLGGNCLARGYLRDPALTERKFVQRDGARWYRTGDLARQDADGTLQFIGRADDQVKIRGFRVELGEVETALAQHPAVREAVAGVTTGATGAQELVGFFVPRDPAAPPAWSDLRRWLATQLPEYLVPSRCAVLASLPLTPSGKVDRRALPYDRAKQAEPPRTAPAAPLTALERTIQQAWEAVLGIGGLSERDNFFELGANSLHAVKVHTKLCQTLEREFPITAIFQHPTVVALAAYLSAGQPKANAAASIQDRARRQQTQQAAAAATAARARLAGAGVRRAD